jgi:hypothetical protein
VGALAEFFDDGATGWVAEGVKDTVDIDLRLFHSSTSSFVLA